MRRLRLGRVGIVIGLALTILIFGCAPKISSLCDRLSESAGRDNGACDDRTLMLHYTFEVDLSGAGPVMPGRGEALPPPPLTERQYQAR